MNFKPFTLLMIISNFFLTACAQSGQPTATAENLQGAAIATFAGGCFWCVESDFEKVPGVQQVISGFSGGTVANPSYELVSAGHTGHVEAVQVYYDPNAVSYEDLLQYFWRQINPTDNQGQFVDRGNQYRPVIFYANEEQKQAAEISKATLQASGRYDNPVVTEITELRNFYPAEDYHQDYYKRNPLRYKYYRYNSGRDQYLSKVWGEELHYQAPTQPKYVKPSDEILRQKLTPLQYRVTQKEATEKPFHNEFWDEKRDGIYVDIVTGEPLFSSKDKFASGTGWPSFTQPLISANIIEKTDYYLLYPRTEVRSKYGDSHLGHVFNDGPKPTGLRYCINSASLRFIPVDRLQAEGYGEFAEAFKTAQ